MGCSVLERGKSGGCLSEWVVGGGVAKLGVLVVLVSSSNCSENGDDFISKGMVQYSICHISGIISLFFCYFRKYLLILEEKFLKRHIYECFIRISHVEMRFFWITAFMLVIFMLLFKVF